jgi:peptidoglycan/xylan/chitin deacetylase (PgdA/CDA1 family)
LVSEMLRRGFLYYDWNISSQDAVSKVSAGEIINNVTRNIRGQKQLVILLHDSRDKTETVKALPGIIKFLKEENYTLAPIDNSVKPIIFSYK